MTSNEAQAQARAAQFRTNHDLGDAPLGDVFEVVHRALGVDVCSIEAAHAEHGLLMKHDISGRACIAVGVTEHPMRQRSSVVHELGHLLAGDLDAGARPAPGVRDPAEVQADAFARHLLLPLSAVKGLPKMEVADTSVLSDVVQAFGVSPALAAIQMRDAGRIRSEVCAAWQTMTTAKLAARHGWLDRYDRMVQDSLQPRPPQGLLSRAVAAYLQGVLGIGELAAWYGRPIDELQDQLGFPEPAADTEDPWDSSASIFPTDPPS